MLFIRDASIAGIVGKEHVDAISDEAHGDYFVAAIVIRYRESGTKADQPTMDVRPLADRIPHPER